MSGQRTLRHRLSGFALWPAVSALTPFLLLPVVARNASGHEWVALMTGQSVGAFLVVAVSGGWTLIGPARTATAEESERALIYYESLVSRLALAAAVFPLGVVVAGMVAPADAWELAATLCVAVSLSALSPAWFAAGIGRPGVLARYDVIPRAVAVVIASVIITQSGWLFAWPLLLSISSTLAILRFKPAEIGSPNPPRALRVVLREQVVPTLTMVAAGGYTAAAIAIVASATDIDAAGRFAAGMRLYQVLVLALASVSLAFQSISLSGAGEHRVAARWHVLVAILGGVGFISISPTATRVLFGSSYAIGYGSAALFAWAFAALAWSTYLTRMVFVPRGLTRPMLVSTSLAAAIGVPLTYLLAARLGCPGAVLGLAVSETIVCSWMLLSYRRIGGQSLSTHPIGKEN